MPRLVLTLDGGGIRGLFEAHVLAALEEQLGRPAADVFDLVSGTSTGGIVALGLAVARRSATQIAELYETRGPEIFHSRFLGSVRQLVVSKYRRAKLDETLREELGDARLSDAATRVVVPAFSLAQRDIVWFDSGSPPAMSNVKVAPGDPLARDVAAATSAAPTYFDPARVAGLEGEWLDGGVGANDPTPYALALALLEEPEVVVLSIGTGGFFPDYPRHLRGSIPIAVRSMPGLLLYPTGLVAHDTAQALAGGTIRVFRLAPDPDRIEPELDDASPGALERLRAEADRVVSTPEAAAAFAALAAA
jgi:patatin-like phospholipase/acyl hydrolase